MHLALKLLIGIGSLIGIIIIWFMIPYSPLKHTFNQIIEKEKASIQGETPQYFTEETIRGLPAPIQNYLKLSGYMGKPVMKYVEVFCGQTVFGMGKDKPNLTIDYHYYNFTKGPKRYAYIKSQLFGVPFEGFDSYVDQVGGMKGVLGKVFTLFNSKGHEMDQAALVTLLGEAIITPSWFLDERLSYELINEQEVKVRIQDGNIQGEGIYHLDERGFIASFTTQDRFLDDGTGQPIPMPWTAEVGEFVKQGDYLLPTKLKGIWHYPEEDYVYFDCDNVQIISR